MGNLDTLFQDNLSWLIAAVVLLLLVFIPQSLALKRQRRKVKNIAEMEDRVEEALREIHAAKGPEQAKLVRAIREKRGRLKNLPTMSFHYADKSRIEEFYNSYFREPITETIVREVAKETEGSVGGDLAKILRSNVRGKGSTKQVNTIKAPGISASEQFLRYQRETIENDQVHLDLELVDVELSQLEKFDTLVKELLDIYNLQISQNDLDEKRGELREHAADRTLRKLEVASGWVLIEAPFLLSADDGKFYKCECRHPVSDYLGNNNRAVGIVVLIPKDAVEEHVRANYETSLGQRIPLRVYGEVWRPVDRDLDEWAVRITPLAVY